MSNFQARFDEASPEARRSFASHNDAIRQSIPRFYVKDFDRLLKSISSLLEKIDKGHIDHPEFLAGTSGNMAELAVTLVLGTPAAIENGADHFLQTTLTAFINVEDRLSRAVGQYYYKVRNIRGRYISEIQKLEEDALEYIRKIRESHDQLAQLRVDYDSSSQEISASLESARDALREITSVKQMVEKLASGDGRGKSLESLKRQAEEKLELIDGVLKKGEQAQLSASTALQKLSESQSQAEVVSASLSKTQEKANEVLALSSQAGLASSYLNESKTLRKRSFGFTCILYIASFITLLLAGFYVIPGLEHNVSGGSNATFTTDALLTTLLRATILAPLVYVIYFTTRQISSLETLRMDYAEKAAASLAYSGYKDEVSVDGNLLEQLRGSLLLRFAEHPERLLRKRPTSESIEIRGPGFSASSTSDNHARGKRDSHDGNPPEQE